MRAIRKTNAAMSLPLKQQTTKPAGKKTKAIKDRSKAGGLKPPAVIIYSGFTEAKNLLSAKTSRKVRSRGPNFRSTNSPTVGTSSLASV